jgi:hypothetical protein
VGLRLVVMEAEGADSVELWVPLLYVPPMRLLVIDMLRILILILILILVLFSVQQATNNVCLVSTHAPHHFNFTVPLSCNAENNTTCFLIIDNSS